MISRFEDIDGMEDGSDANGKNAVDALNIDHVTPSTVVDEQDPPLNSNMAFAQQLDTPARTSQPFVDRNRVSSRQKVRMCWLFVALLD